MYGISEDLLARRVVHDDFGFPDSLTWNATDAILILDKLSQQKLYVLGGDVYRILGDRIRSTYDNWCCEYFGDEPLEDYRLRSIAKALEYIRPLVVDPSLIIGLVVSESPVERRQVRVDP
ncbi:MAG: hypothetical protein H7X80_02880 [bacterium]|nr:hypothetical protein [Candidatus Kapabacteria bacterium]